MTQQWICQRENESGFVVVVVFVLFFFFNRSNSFA